MVVTGLSRRIIKIGILTEIKNVTIIGLGLIGGSWGLALKRKLPWIKICGIDIDEDSIEFGLENNCIDWGTTDYAEGVKEADLVIAASLVSSIPAVIKEIIPYLKAGCIITDVGSTKKHICDCVEGYIESSTRLSDVYYIGGHPMAGSEVNGIKGADPDLFENAVYILTPTASTNKKALGLVEKIVKEVGAEVLYLSPEEHDSMAAAISHLPHVLSAALVGAVGKMENKNDLFKLAAGGFRDLTRVADSSPEMWRDILMQNRCCVLKSLKIFKDVLHAVEEAIKDSREKEIYDFFKNAQAARRSMKVKI